MLLFPENRYYCLPPIGCFLGYLWPDTSHKLLKQVSINTEEVLETPGVLSV